LPVLITAVEHTEGPIVELGCGMHSTPFLHWACYASCRRLVTYERDQEWYEAFEAWRTGGHVWGHADDWDAVDLSPPWSVALVDHRPARRRYVEAMRLAHADVVLVHDAERVMKGRGYRALQGAFRKRYRYVVPNHPGTLVLSNVLDLRDIVPEPSREAA
jgi:hypothetical protein